MIALRSLMGWLQARLGADCGDPDVA